MRPYVRARASVAFRRMEAHGVETVSIKETPGKEYVLVDLLRSWKLPESVVGKISDRWKCQIAPFATDEADLNQHVLDGIPVLTPSRFGERACSSVGEDCLEYLIDNPERNTFPKPKIAFVAGWGRPGSILIDDEELRVVNSFEEVLNGDPPLNLQMFHRSDEGEPNIPRFPELLDWPLPALFSGSEEELRVPCDMATRVSAKQALTWWHLDDGGEFLLQVGLPLKEVRCKQQESPVLLGPSGKPVVKLFVFAARNAYDILVQDKESNKTHRFSHLDLFNVPSHALPEPGSDYDPLPTLWVAPLEAGGRPLLSPPNVPHLVLTLQHCVMVEERVIHKLFLDEVHYFMEKAEGWAERPIFYPFLKETLQDADKVRDEVVGPLLKVLREGTPDQVRARARESLATVVKAAGKHFVVHPETVSEIETALADPAVQALEKDKRALEQEELMQAFSRTIPDGVTAFPNDRFAGHVHIGGSPWWGPLRETPEEAVKDRKEMISLKNKKGLGALDEHLRKQRGTAQGRG